MRKLCLSFVFYAQCVLCPPDVRYYNYRIHLCLWSVIETSLIFYEQMHNIEENLRLDLVVFNNYFLDVTLGLY